MRFPRLTTRRLMAIVAVVAVVLEGGIVWDRYTYHRNRAASAVRIATGLRRMMARMPATRLAKGTTLDFDDGSPSFPATPEACRQFLAHLDRIARKHAYAARHPWLPVPPDPPPPK